MFNKFFKFLFGYVIIRIYGRGAERFLNICLRRGMDVWDVFPRKNGIEMKLSVDAFKRIRPVAFKCGVRVKMLEKRGLVFTARRYGKRYALFVSILLAVTLCFVSSQFIWLVEINGAEKSDIDDIIASLDSVGVRSGAWKGSLPDGDEMKRAIINGSDHIAWAWVYIEGAKARVEIYESIIPPVVLDRETPCDVVASCDGVIKKINVKNGEGLLKEGDAVSAGDVIVSGRVPVYKEDKPEEYMFVHSMADVEAYTSEKKTGDYKLYYESRTPTGRRGRRLSVEFLGKIFPLPFFGGGYENFDSEERRHELYIPFFGYTGVALDVIEYDEVNVNREPISTETALEFAKNDLEGKISKELTPMSVLTDEKLEYEKTDNETIRVTLEMNFVRNIAVEQPLGGE